MLSLCSVGEKKERIMGNPKPSFMTILFLTLCLSVSLFLCFWVVVSRPVNIVENTIPLLPGLENYKQLARRTWYLDPYFLGNKLIHGRRYPIRTRQGLIPRVVTNEDRQQHANDPAFENFKLKPRRPSLPPILERTMYINFKAPVIWERRFKT